MNKLMNRIQLASKLDEDLVLDQLTNDIQLAQLNGSLTSDQYSIKSFSDYVIIHDLVNDEYTKAYTIGDSISLEKASGVKLNSGDSVSWLDNNKLNRGILMGSANNNKSLVHTGMGISSIDSTRLTPDTSTRDFSHHSLTHNYLVDSTGDIKAYGHARSLGRLHKLHPEWKLIDKYELNKFNKTKKFSNLSDGLQKLFTRQNRVWAILDKSGKLVRKVDISLVKGQLKDNPGFTAIKDSEYRKSLQVKNNNFK